VEIKVRKQQYGMNLLQKLEDGTKNRTSPPSNKVLADLLKEQTTTTDIITPPTPSSNTPSPNTPSTITTSCTDELIGMFALTDTE
jgi:hypothetical protein